jgi:tetratricopeptide (TPR) repeat protein
MRRRDRRSQPARAEVDWWSELTYHRDMGDRVHEPPEFRAAPTSQQHAAQPVGYGWASNPQPSDGLTISDELLEGLTHDLASRRMGAGLTWLQTHVKEFGALQANRPGTARFVGCLAQWVDMGFARPALVKTLLSRFTPETRAQLPLGDYLHLRMAEGMSAMADEEPDQAIQHLDFALTLGEELGDRATLAIASFWKGRCLRKKGEYDEALTCTARAEGLAEELGYPKLAAVMRVLESWLLFQKGRSHEATLLLRQAEAALADTDDYLTLGNIHSSHGRIARRQRLYDRAIASFEKAIAEYRKRDPQHRNLARTLVNIAIVQRYIGVQLRDHIDSATRRSRETGTRGERRAATRVGQLRERLRQLREEAFAHLDEARQIYLHDPDHHGSSAVHLNVGYVHLDGGEFDRASEEAAAAFRVAEEKLDFLLMARARLLQCMIENAQLEEDVGERPDPAGGAGRALESIREAVALARHTQNRRLLATALVWQGLTECNSVVNDFEAAQHSYELATTTLKGEDPGNLSADLNALRGRLFRSGTVDPLLRAWTQGLVGVKTFRQVLDDFSELVIPRVWEREGRKVARVAARLSMSPKKVRRILARAGRRKSLKS